jgi:lactoylglutathione lyase
MPAVNLNHVSVHANDLEESLRFYEDLFAVIRVATPNFGFPVQWTRVGPLQLHIFENRGPAPFAHHFAITVDDFDAVFEKARTLAAFDRSAFGHHLYELPGGEAQMYLRDPAGNLVEVNARSIEAVSPAIRAEARRLDEGRPQGPQNQRARLFLD